MRLISTALFCQIMLLVASLYLGVACNDDETSLPTQPVVGERVKATFGGTVVDTLNMPLAGVIVSIGDLSTESDGEGRWLIDSADVVSTAAFIRFEKDQYLSGSRTLLVLPNGQYNVVQQLLRRNVLQVDGTAGGSLTVPGSGAELVFPASAFAKTNGTPYSGPVRVSTHYLDPTREAFPLRMPGDLRAFTLNNEEGELTSYGMMSVELTDATGAKLELRAGVKATLKMPIPASLQAQAPPTIALWYFDDTRAAWVEEGQATRSGDTYVGEVSHFTWWNCDFWGELTKICGRIIFKEPHGPILSRNGSNGMIKIVPDMRTGRFGNANAEGEFCAIVPAGAILKISIAGRSNCTSGESQSVTLGPFPANGCIDVGDLTFELPEFSSTTVAGRVYCGGTPISAGVITASPSYVQTFIQPDGTFSLTFPECGLNNRVTLYAQTPGGQKIMVLNYQSGAVTTLDSISVCPKPIDPLLQFYIGGQLVHQTDQFRLGINSATITLTPTGIESTGQVIVKLSLQSDSRLTVGSYLMRRTSSVAWLTVDSVETAYDLAPTTLNVLENDQFGTGVFKFNVGPYLAEKRDGGQDTVELRVTANY